MFRALASVLSFVPVVVAWAGHTDHTRRFVQILEKHRDAAGMKMDTFADALGLQRTRLSHQLTDGEPLNLYRFVDAAMRGALPPSFVVGVFRDFLLPLGARVLDSEDVALLERAFALGKKRMARILASAPEERRRA